MISSTSDFRDDQPPDGSIPGSYTERRAAHKPDNNFSSEVSPDGAWSTSNRPAPMAPTAPPRPATLPAEITSSEVGIYDPTVLLVDPNDTVESRHLAYGSPLGSQTTVMSPTGLRIPSNGQELWKNQHGGLVPTGNYRRNGYLVSGPQYEVLRSLHRDSVFVRSAVVSDVPVRLARTPEEAGLIAGRPLRSRKRAYMVQGKRRVPLTDQGRERRGGILVGTGEFYKKGWLVAGHTYDEIMADYAAKPLAERAVYAFGRFLRALLVILWTILKVIGFIFIAVKMVQGIHDVEQTFSGPNSIANTNRNINNYISRQNQRR